MIFIACATPSSRTLNRSHWFLSANMQWIAVTHVCRYWRSVALGCADLWRRLFFFNPDVTKEMIRRSQAANLEVIVDPPDASLAVESVNKVIEIVLPELHRVSVLHLAILQEPLQSLVDGFVHAAPELESLYLYCLYGISKSVHVPDAIFSRQTPALRSLELYNCIFTSPSPSSTPFPSSDSQMVRIPSTIPQIVSFLCRTPMLHTLTLCNVLPEHLFTDTDAYPKLMLPKLSRLLVTSSVVSCAILLEHLIFPITTNITLQCDQNPLRNDDYRRLFHAFLSAIGNDKANFVISVLELKIEYNGNYVGMVYTMSHSHRSAPTKVAFIFYTEDNGREIYQDVFNTASIILPPAEAHGLDITGNAAHWPINFESLPNLRTIRFKTYDFPLEIVGAALGVEGHSHKLPYLCNLQFFNLAFSDEGTATLMNGLKYRLHSGFPIKNIFVRSCDLNEVDVTRMKEFVQDVKWDGHTSSGRRS
jgi:F-box-like